jgi:peptidoglycan/LPS O-acetylase OafA/YrhL
LAAVTPHGVESGVPLAPRHAYRQDIDGLRAISILLVVAFHAGAAGFEGGYVGVDVFFVLSGYLITGLLIAEHERTGSISLREFYARRVRRLLPLASVVLIATLAVGAWLVGPLARPQLARDAVAAAFYVANWRFAGQATAYSDTQVTDGLLVHYWSLSVEEQYYLLWPLMVVFAAWLASRRSGRRLVPVLGVLLAVLVVASFAASVVLSVRLGPEAYYLTHTRLWEMGAGAALALVAPALPRLPRAAAETSAAVGLALVLVAAMTYDATTPFPGTAALAPVVGALLVIASGAGAPTLIGRGLQLRPLPTLGRLSYAWYLWHWPAIGLGLLLNDRLGEPGRPGVVVSLAVAGSLGLAAVSHVSIENPVRHWGVLRGVPRRNFALGIAASLAPLLLAMVFVSGETGRTPVAIAADTDEDGDARGAAVAAEAAGSGTTTAMSPAQAAEDGVEIDGGACIDGPSEVVEVADGCVFGDPGAEVTVVLLGDSHAQHWLPTLDAAGREQGWRILSWSKSACVPLDVPIWDYRREQPFDACAVWRATVAGRLAAEPRVDAIVLGRSFNYHQYVLDAEGARPEDDPDTALRAWQDGAARTFEHLASVTDRVVLLRDTPWAAEGVPDCLASSPASPEVCDIDVSEHGYLDEAIHGAEVAAAARREAVAVLDPTPLVCPQDPCPVVTAEGLIKYRDRHHLTQRFATSLAEDFAREFAPFLADGGDG